jgi:hypothetical protein
MRFSAIRSPPVMPKARATSRLPALPFCPPEFEDLLAAGERRLGVLFRAARHRFT